LWLGLRAKVKPRRPSATLAAKCDTLQTVVRKMDLPMIDRMLLSVAVLWLLAAGAHSAPKPPAPKECPIEDLSREAREDGLRGASSCNKSLELFELCSYGASGDVSLGAIVTAKCEGDFLARLSVKERRRYKQAQMRCARKYQHNPETMYRSFEAFCGAELARTYSRRFGPKAGASAPRS